MDEPMASVYPDGQIRFNAKATERWLADADSVGLYADVAAGRFGVSVGETGEDSYSLSNVHGGAVVRCRRALARIGVDLDATDEAVRLPVSYDPDEGLLIVDCEPALEVAADE
jgi:hypothetical protein